MGPAEGHLEPFSREWFRPHWGFLDLRAGVGAALFLLVPVAVGLAAGQAAGASLVAIGALNLLLLDPVPPTPRLSPGLLLLGCATNSAAFAGGVVVGSFGPPAVVPLVALGVFVALLGYLRPRTNQLALIASVLFVVGVGLPAEVGVAAGVRVGLLAGGSLWGLVALLVLRRFPRPNPERRDLPPVAPSVPSGRAGATHAAVVALAAAVGLSVGLSLDLPRDIWIMLTVIVVLRVDLASTYAYTVMRVVGTVGGAAVAFLVTNLVAEPVLLGTLLGVSAAATFAVRGVNYTLYATCLTFFLILLLNSLFTGGPGLAEARVLDTLIGGAIGLVAGAMIAAVHRRERWRGGLRLAPG